MRRGALASVALLPALLVGCTVNLPGSNSEPTATVTVTQAPSPTQAQTQAPQTQAPAQQAPQADYSWLPGVRSKTTTLGNFSDQQLYNSGRVWCALVESNLGSYPDENSAIVQAFNNYKPGNGASPSDAGVIAGAATVALCPQYLDTIQRVRAANGATG